MRERWLHYGSLEKVTVASILQEKIAQDKETALRAIDYAYY